MRIVASAAALTDNSAAVIAFAVALASPVLVRSITRPRSDSWRGVVSLVAEVVAVVVLAALLTRYAAIPALHWRSVRIP